MTHNHLDEMTATVARILLGGFFVYSALENLLHLSKTAERLDIAGATIVVLIVVAFKIICGLSLAFRYHAKYMALILTAYLLIVNFMFYGPSSWDLTELNKFIFIRNVAIIGGLLFVVAHSRGYSLWSDEFLPEDQRKIYKDPKHPPPQIIP